MEKVKPPRALYLAGGYILCIAVEQNIHQKKLRSRVWLLWGWLEYTLAAQEEAEALNEASGSLNTLMVTDSSL